jgi:hypothetical protein
VSTARADVGSTPETTLAALRGIGCPVCRVGERRDERFTFWFCADLYHQPAILNRLRSSIGFCPGHTRLLLHRRPARYVLRYVYADVVPAARERLLHPAARPRPTRCLGCEDRADAEARTITSVLATLGDAAVVAAYRRTGGFCPDHLVHAFRTATPDQAVLLVRLAHEPLPRGADGESAFSRLVSENAGTLARASPRDGLARIAAVELADSVESTLDRLRRRLAYDACPVCLAGGLTEVRYLTWLADQRSTDRHTPDVGGARLCRAHVLDLDCHDPVAARWATLVERSRVLFGIRHVGSALESLPEATGAGRVIAAAKVLQTLPRRWRRAPAVLGAAARHLVTRRGAVLGAAVAPLLYEPPCAACRAVQAAEASELELVSAALDDAPTARRYEASHGLCLRHTVALPHGLARDLAVGVLTSRLTTLAWELDEAGRKASWSFRYESHGPEMTAWYRAPALLDGRVFLGAPPANPAVLFTGFGSAPPREPVEDSS